MTAAEWSVSGSPANFRGRTMGALNAPAKVVKQWFQALVKGGGVVANNGRKLLWRSSDRTWRANRRVKLSNKTAETAEYRYNPVWMDFLHRGISGLVRTTTRRRPFKWRL
ncbi:uncharacterized protein LOC116415281 [Apis florea]|uniref:uncharacterized protein LOC116415281 n=1 Tax=Apis florea TaxID=7463 RepID=UPI0012FEFE5A|nr:uncharacterized protein LOC116415281 [Apis florea]